MLKSHRITVEIAERIAAEHGCTISHKINGASHLMVTVRRPDGQVRKFTAPGSPRVDNSVSHAHQNTRKALRALGLDVSGHHLGDQR